MNAPTNERSPVASRLLRCTALLAALALAPGAALAGIDYPDFSSTAGLTLVGDAREYGGALRLTRSAVGQRGAAWYNAKELVTSGFVTTFEFRISQPYNAADGLAFVIQNHDDAALGADGSGLGYQSIPNALAIEFDTWGESMGDHVSVQERGGWTPEGSLGYTNRIPELSDGALHTAVIEYRPGTMSIFLDNRYVPVLTVALNLEDYVRSEDGLAFVGFTAATGLFTQNHDILSWRFESSECPFATFEVPTAALSFRENEEGRDQYVVAGSFTLGPDSTGIFPLDDPFLLDFGSTKVRILPGSFQVDGSTYTYDGTFDGALVHAILRDRGHGAWAFDVAVQNADLSGTSNVLRCLLAVGDDRGLTTLRLGGRLCRGCGGTFVVTPDGLPAR